MIEYKRFISYIYAYAGGVRDKNTGFAKAQVQGQKFELAINLRGVYTDTPEYMNVSFVMQKEENKSKYRLLLLEEFLSTMESARIWACLCREYRKFGI